MATRGNFSIETERDGTGKIRLTPAGELDIATAPMLEQALREQSTNGSPILLDLSQLSFLDSTGLHLLVQMRRDADERGWTLEITRPVGEASRVIEVTRMARVLRLADS